MRKWLVAIGLAISASTFALPIGPVVASTTPAEQVGLYSNAVDAAFTTFKKQLSIDINAYTSNGINAAVAGQIADHAHAMVTPLENLQAAALNVSFNGQTRHDGASLAVAITKYIYILGIVGFGALTISTLTSWFNSFKSENTLYSTYDDKLAFDFRS